MKRPSRGPEGTSGYEAALSALAEDLYWTWNSATFHSRWSACATSPKCPVFLKSLKNGDFLCLFHIMAIAAIITSEAQSYMISELERAVATARNLQEVCDGLVSFLTEARLRHPQIGFVSGIISSDGREKIFQNLEILRHRTVLLRKRLGYPVLSAACVWNKKLYDRIAALDMSDQEWFAFWRRVLRAGVSDLYLTPRWEVSRGARDEFAAAQEIGLRIHLVLFHRGVITIRPYAETAQIQLALD